MITITTMTELPEYCYDCPCHNGEHGTCNVDEKERITNEYRPFWCPLKVQKQTKEDNLTPFDVLDIISSSYGGKQIFFQENNGMIYDRYKGEYITFEDAVNRMARMIGDDGDV